MELDGHCLFICQIHVRQRLSLLTAQGLTVPHRSALLTVTREYCYRACDKLPSDAVAPLGLGKLLDVAQQRLDERKRPSTRGWLVPVPPEERLALLGETAEAEMSTEGMANRKLLQEMQESRMSLLHAVNQVGLKRVASISVEDDAYDTHPPSKRAACSGSTVCQGCQRSDCLCVQL